jgi:flagellar protein FlaG
MTIEPVYGSGRGLALPVQAEPPVARISVSNSSESSVEKAKPDLSDITNRVADAQRNLNVMHAMNLHFSIHEASGQTIVRVVDEATGEVIREIPSSEMLNLAAKLDEMIGLIFDQKG